MSDEHILNTDGQSDENSGELRVVKEDGVGYSITVKREDLLRAAASCKEAGFDLFLFVTGVDMPDKIKLVYRIFSTKKSNKLAMTIRTEVPKDDPVIDSVVPIWSAANWHERETYDLLGVIFRGHPDPRRIFMPDDWVGHPLRKDYKHERIIPYKGYTSKSQTSVITEDKSDRSDIDE
ncbi:MAG: NADH-quinone oxidoreductase subunit C [Firmicutes bacterium]|nr:NADH-quinone oxidoreductase subunit C [Bacillota bacterium]